MQLTRLIYSSNHDGLAFETVDHILQKSRANNVASGITGAMVITDKHFTQILEGDRIAVSECFMRIIQDDRHRNIQVICAGDVEHRLFSEWSMHLIKASCIKQEILSRYMINGTFDPAGMSEDAVGDLCRALAAGDWETLAT